ncbi:MAG: hypothetical protein IPM66_09080 [Acidobacteriota bacterium]|nr:MAG: hypothetical protein IPM66_09080 [Acidobacteriota bacterium]
MKKVVSFSLWGDHPKYCVGAIRNARLCVDLYKDWVPRFYVGTSVPQSVINTLKISGAEIIHMKTPGDWRGLFWRFTAIADSDVDVMISRDCDSRVSQREILAVNDWLSSSLLFHIMRDHPAHCTKILGGMWGVKAPLLKDICQLIDEFNVENSWQNDQVFLRKIVYPRIKRFALVHDEFFNGVRFPTIRNGLEFVGQVYDQNDETLAADRADLQKALNGGLLISTIRRLRLL